ncbi:MAG: hypothetical protein ACQESR_05785 [Planctomycetota bacterium]
MSEFTRYDEAECVAVFDRLFPHGFVGGNVIEEIAPGGWPRSPLVAVFHPTAEQIYDESLRMHENIQSLRRSDADRPSPPPPNRAEIAARYRPSPVETEREIRELVGMCVWDLFSDGHKVVDASGRAVDLGSFRASGGFIADWLNRRMGQDEYDYTNFYLGTIWVSQRADLTQIYRMIFRRLKEGQFDWIYRFPRLHLVDLRPLNEHLNRDEEPEWVDYDPCGAIAEQQEEAERQQRLAEMRASLDESYREAVEAARDAPPPTTVAAYRSIYNHFPRGWPPECEP